MLVVGRFIDNLNLNVKHKIISNKNSLSITIWNT